MTKGPGQDPLHPTHDDIFWIRSYKQLDKFFEIFDLGICLQGTIDVLIGRYKGQYF